MSGVPGPASHEPQDLITGGPPGLVIGGGAIAISYAIAQIAKSIFGKPISDPIKMIEGLPITVILIGMEGNIPSFEIIDPNSVPDSPVLDLPRNFDMSKGGNRNVLPSKVIPILTDIIKAIKTGKSEAEVFKQFLDLAKQKGIEELTKTENNQLKKFIKYKINPKK